MSTTNLKHLIANLRKAAFNRQEVSIAGGIFEAAELEAAANVIEASTGLLSHCERLLWLLDNHNGAITQTPEAIKDLRNTITKAKGQR